MELFTQWLSFIRTVGSWLFDLINGSWLLGTMIALQVIYLVIIAVKLKKNTD